MTKWKQFVALVVKNLPANARDLRELGLIPGSGRSSGRRKWQPTPVFLPGEPHGQQNLVGYSLWGHKESDTTEVAQCAHTTLNMNKLPRWLRGKETACWCNRCRRPRFDPWVGKILWSRKWKPTPVFLPGKFHGQRSLAGYSPWGSKESDTTDQGMQEVTEMY